MVAFAEKRLSRFFSAVSLLLVCGCIEMRAVWNSFFAIFVTGTLGLLGCMQWQ